MHHKQIELEIDDHTYLGSTIGNAFFSGLTMEQLFDAVVVSSNREELDCAVSTAIKLKELLNK